MTIFTYMTIQIRKMSEGDIPAIHGLVLDLADYEKAPDKVTTTVKSYLDDYRSGSFDAYVGEVEGSIQGMALYCRQFSSWRGRMLYLEDFIVREEYRKLGLGKLLFEAFLTEARNQDVALVKWQVLDWNDLAIRFYEKYPTEFDREWVDCKIFFRE